MILSCRFLLKMSFGLREMRSRCAALHNNVSLQYSIDISLTTRKKNTARQCDDSPILANQITHSLDAVPYRGLCLLVSMKHTAPRLNNFALTTDVWSNNSTKIIAFYFVPCYIHFEVSSILTKFIKPTKIISIVLVLKRDKGFDLVRW